MLFGIIWLTVLSIVSGVGIVYRCSSGQYVLVHEKQLTYHRIADQATADSLAFLQSNISTISTDSLASYRVGNDIAHNSFPVNGFPTPDDALVVTIKRFTLLQPNDHVVRISSLKDIVNPSIIRVRDRILMTYCPPVWHPLRSTMFFGWLNESSRFEYQFNPADTFYSINNSLHLIPNSEWNVIQQDSRLLLLNPSPVYPDVGYDVLLTYSSGFKYGCHFYYCHIRFSHGKANSLSDPELKALVTPSVDLNTDWGGAFQKNWVSFEHKNKVMFIETINPLRILELVEEQPVADFSKAANVTLKVVHSQPAIHLPWNDVFPSAIRGGTNAIHVRYFANSSSFGSGGHSSEYYLAFFHTKDKQSSFYQMSSYFIGAMTLCPHPPFNIHSMSRLPITVDEWLYTGKWLSNAVNYVLYPTGIMLDPHDSSKVVVSMGYQDNDARIVVFDISKLLDSLEYVSDCKSQQLQK